MTRSSTAGTFGPLSRSDTPRWMAELGVDRSQPPRAACLELTRAARDTAVPSFSRLRKVNGQSG
jgi:hypothetical protein